MSGSHGDLFREIGKLVLAAHAGQSIDLAAKSEELAERYGNLDMPAELIAKAIARSLSAISVSMAIISERHAATGSYGANGNGHANGNGSDDAEHVAINGNGHSNGHSNGANGHGANGHAANGKGHEGANGNGHANGDGEPHTNGVGASHDDEADDQSAEDQAQAASELFTDLPHGDEVDDQGDVQSAENQAQAASELFPSGLRLSVLS